MKTLQHSATNNEKFKYSQVILNVISRFEQTAKWKRKRKEVENKTRNMTKNQVDDAL